jgi:hypothetical protein
MSCQQTQLQCCRCRVNRPIYSAADVVSTGPVTVLDIPCRGHVNRPSYSARDVSLDPVTVLQIPWVLWTQPVTVSCCAVSIHSLGMKLACTGSWIQFASLCKLTIYRLLFIATFSCHTALVSQWIHKPLSSFEFCVCLELRTPIVPISFSHHIIFLQ